MHVPGPAFAMRPPRAAGPHRRRRFDIQPGLVGETTLQRLERRPPEIASERRIDENQVEAGGVGTFRRPTQPAQRIGADHLHPLTARQLRRERAQAFGKLRVALHQHRLTRTARHRFQPQRAGAGEQVQHPRAGQHRLQPVEERLADAVGGRAQTIAVGDRQTGAAPVAADDADHTGRLRRDRAQHPVGRALHREVGFIEGQGRRVITFRHCPTAGGVCVRRACSTRHAGHRHWADGQRNMPPWPMDPT